MTPWVAISDKSESRIVPTADYPKARPPLPGAQGGFKIVLENVLLSDRRDSQGVPRVYGDVARMPSGDLIARWKVTLSDHTEVWCYQPYDHEQPVETVGLRAATDWQARLDSLYHHAGGDARHHVLQPPAQSENDRFVATFPELAAEFGKKLDVAPPRVFASGPVRYPIYLTRQANVGLPPDFWRDLVDGHHTDGFFVVYGDLTSVPELEPHVFLHAHDYDVATQNAMSLAAGVGPVLSRYPVPDDVVAVLPALEACEHCRYVIDVLTVLFRRRGNQTLMPLGKELWR